VKVPIENREVAGLYLLLKGEERRLDATLSALLSRLERALYSVLSIDEMEHLNELYERKVDLFGGRG